MTDSYVLKCSAVPRCAASSAGSPSTDGASTSAPLQEAPASDDRAPIMFSPSIHTATMSPFGMRATPGTDPPMISGSRVISW